MPTYRTDMQEGIVKPSYSEIFEICKESIDIEKNRLSCLDRELIATLPAGPEGQPLSVRRRHARMD